MRFLALSRWTVAGFRLGVSLGPEDFKRKRPGATIEGGFVYVVTRANGDVKVGQTRNPPQRLRDLQTASAERLQFAFVAATTAHEEVEDEAKAILERYRMRGEWFEVEPETAAAAICAAAARCGRKLHIVDARAAATQIPPIIREVADRAMRRRALRNAAILASGLAAGGFAASQAVAFIDAHQDPMIRATAAVISAAPVSDQKTR